MKRSPTRIVAVRITRKLAEMMHEYCKRDAHINFSDFIRDAIREKIQREAPELYHKFLGGAQNHEQR